jgi:hypothetical protein
MKQLKPDWLTEGLIDFEYKKYILLDYLQNVQQAFGRAELYPFLSDLVMHYRNLQTVREGKTLLSNAFPRELSAERVQRLELLYQRVVEDDDLMAEIESIIDYALPKFKNSLDEGISVYEYVESQCELTLIGLTTLYTDEGYLFVTQPPQTDTAIYRYQLSVFEQGQYRGLHLAWHTREVRSLTNTFEAMKLRLARENRELPQPTTYLLVTKATFPYEGTVLPVAKRMLIKCLTKAA